MLNGIVASPGIAIGKVYIIKEQRIVINKEPINTSEMALEIEKFENAIQLSCKQLRKIKNSMLTENSKEAEIFEAHLMILEDELLKKEVKEKIKEEHISAEFSMDQILKNYIEKFNSMESEYLKERATDIKDVGERIIKNILGLTIQSFKEIREEVIVVAKDLTPSDTAQMDRNFIKGFATDMGGRTSHTAIMARSMEIPAVVGLSSISSIAKDGDIIIVDGNTGTVLINPIETVLNEYVKLKKNYKTHLMELQELKHKACETTCRERRVELSANIGSPKDSQRALDFGAEGVGLFRTEFLYMDRTTFPSEEEQFQAYKEVAETMEHKRVIIRTLDIGGDKKLPYMEMPEEMNPFLGWRAIRLCLDRPDILKTQLKAILRASHYGNLLIMYPMISNVEEVRRANRVLQHVREELEHDEVPFDKNIQVGIMVEIPSAAITADIFAKEVDFFSIGTNDLIQYSLAVDRMNERIYHLYEPFHPAVLRLIKTVIDASHKEGKWTGMCGEMAGDALAAPILLGMGIDELSMSAPSIPLVKKVIRSLSYQEAKALATKALQMEKPEDIKMMVQAVIKF